MSAITKRGWNPLKYQLLEKFETKLKVEEAHWSTITVNLSTGTTCQYMDLLIEASLKEEGRGKKEELKEKMKTKQAN
jgi:hypothetical protein